MSTTITQVVTDVSGLIRSAMAELRTQDLSQLTESIPDTPLIQVYPEEGEASATSGTDRKTFGGGPKTPVRVRPLTMHIDIYGRQRSDIGQDLLQATNVLDGVLQALEGQNDLPFFGNVGIRSFKYTWKRAQFEYGDPKQSYVGYRIILVTTIF